ncbi:hypothetical protein B0T25DRAFT_451861 [Lasiosphaeria hispida]|uniref:Thioredoxin-like fold domain-containing protein n=1 Tax=Lasiosphaeria hispida TaxID=260671 RepID=A0AAJ0MGK6_9PEZI|nr:hypothetical protein B0T25DRAFT_451861 [Lasiosphaeria hispida]
MSPKPIPALTLYRGFPSKPTYAWSPFVNKLETRLRLSAVPYRAEPGSKQAAPRGKLPYLAIQPPDAPAQVLGDSTLITRALVSAGVLPDLNAALTPADRGRDLALRALLEDKMYFYLVRERWVDNYYKMRAGALWAVPWALRALVGLLASRQVVAVLFGQGTGRFDKEEVNGFKREVWEGVEGLLREARTEAGPFWVLGGAQPTEGDAVVYGFVIAALVCDAAPEMQKMVREFPTIMEYAGRIHDAYFPDYDHWEEQV